MPFDQQLPERDDREEGAGHVWWDWTHNGQMIDRCRYCKLTGDAYSAYPETPCDAVIAAEVNDRVLQVRLRIQVRRGSF